MRATCIDVARSPLQQCFGHLRQRARRINHVVHDARRAPFDLPDDVQDLGDIGPFAPFVNAGQFRIQARRIGARALDPTGIRRDNDQIWNPLPAEIFDEHRGGEEMVHRDAEEPLNLAGMQIHRQDARGSRRRQEIGHELGRDGHARLVLPILPGVAEVGDHRRDPLRRCPPKSIQHDEQLHEIGIHRRTRGLNHEDIGAAHVLQDLKLNLSIAEAPQERIAQGDLQVPTDLFG